MVGPAFKSVRMLLNGIVPLLLVAQTVIFPTAADASAYLQCVPFARELSGVQIYGDAHTWWEQAEGRYERGNQPREGAVLSLKGHGNMRLGHVAVVSKIIDDRNILLSHANWSPINGSRGQIERNVAAVDVSKRGDWSRVKIWYAPLAGLGKTAYPANGFIYSQRVGDPNQAARQWVSSNPVQQSRAPNRNLFARNMTAELQYSARQEELANSKYSEQPADLIGELLDRIGS